MSRTVGSSIITKSGQVIDVLTQAHRPLKFSEIVERTGFVKSSCHRILAILQSEQLVEYDTQSRSYRSGARLHKWARAVWNRADIQQAASAGMADLCERTRMNVALSILDNDSVLYLRTVDFFNARFASHAGDRASLHATAAGKVFLSHMVPARRQATLKRITLEKFTDFTVVSRAQLNDQCLEAAEAGFAVADREEALQVTGIAAPVFGADGSVVASLSLWSVAEAHSPAQVIDQSGALLHSAGLVSGELGAV